jgi:hypothetical protein
LRNSLGVHAKNLSIPASVGNPLSKVSSIFVNKLNPVIIEKAVSGDVYEIFTQGNTDSVKIQSDI